MKKCVGKEAFERMNYLYQVSKLMTKSNDNNPASSLYSHLLVSISRKTVQKLDIGLKRTICKRCHCLLVAGTTCKVRIKKKKCCWTCLKCNTTKSFALKNRDYTPWTQRDESIVEILDYSKDE